MYARVVVDTGATSSIEPLTYEIPDGLAPTAGLCPGHIEDGDPAQGKRLGVGSCVLVPLGPRQAVGYVIGFEETSPVENTRPIIAVLEDAATLTPSLRRLAEWISSRYLCPLPRVELSMLPDIFHWRVQARVEAVLPSDRSGDPPPSSENEHPALTPAEAAIASAIAVNGGEASVASLGDDRERVQRLLRQLEKKGVVRRTWKLISPGGKPRVLKGVRIAAGASPSGFVVSRDQSADTSARLPEKQAAALQLIASLGRDVTIAELTQRHGLTASPIASLCKKGLLEEIDLTFRRNPTFARIEQRRVTLSEEQRAAVEAITSAIDSGSHQGHLLFGVTASGKTEVYLRCIEYALELGKTSLVLLPEIALTTQVMNIFKSRLGDTVAVLHSALSAGERCDEWARINEGEARVVLGARSAVFAPLENLGLVVVDEEHEGSYKQDTSPRYNGRDVAVKRAQDAGAALVLGSATPSVETFHLAREGVYGLLTMPSRIENRPMPTVHVADLREEFAQGKATIFSRRLEEGIRNRLERKEQVILLQNRRAYSTFLLCRDCGFVARCPNCAVSLKFHSAARKLSCHHCGFVRPAPDVCPKCQSLRIRKFGIGTERVEEETRKIFPDARVLRMDRDTTSRKGSHAAILNEFRSGEADILVGTQMIAKGLDFPNVTLVGVISADTSLNLPDFRASERTFQLISQVAGRSGRGTTPGEVVIQTMDPDNYAIQSAVTHDYISFFEQELEMRRELLYPPFATLVNVLARNETNSAARAAVEELGAEIKKLPMSIRKDVRVSPPVPAVLSKLKNMYRWHLVLRSTDREAVLGVLHHVFEANPSLRRKLTVDVDPVSML